MLLLSISLSDNNNHIQVVLDLAVVKGRGQHLVCLFVFCLNSLSLCDPLNGEYFNPKQSSLGYLPIVNVCGEITREIEGLKYTFKIKFTLLTLVNNS